MREEERKREGEPNPTEGLDRLVGLERRGREEGSEGVPEATPQPRVLRNWNLPAWKPVVIYLNKVHLGMQVDAAARCMRARYSLFPSLLLPTFARVSSTFSHMRFVSHNISRR